MTEREELTCPKTGKPIDRKWIGKWSDSLYLAFCDCGKVHELVRTDGESAAKKESPAPLAELEPHAYFPSIMHMGDCAVCGHLQGAAIHSPERRCAHT